MVDINMYIYIQLDGLMNQLATGGQNIEWIAKVHRGTRFFPRIGLGKMNAEKLGISFPFSGF
jgi:hypothetical protein